MYHLELSVELVLEGPFTTKSSAVGGYGVDAVLLRTPDGRPLLPGTQVRGRLRDALEELAAADAGLKTDIDQAWFGPSLDRPDGKTLLDPEIDDLGAGDRRESLHFSDFLAPEEFRSDGSAENLLVRIQLDRSTGSVAKGALLTAETAADPGRRISFVGTIDLTVASPERLERAADRIYRGLCWVPAFGSFRSVGFGRVVDVQITAVRLLVWPGGQAKAGEQALSKALERLLDQPPRVEVKTVAGPQGSEPLLDLNATACFDVAVTFLDPFCVGARRTVRNLVESVSYLSGAVLKGAVAAALRALVDVPPGGDLGQAKQPGTWAQLAQQFGNLRFCSAFPAAPAAARRPVRPPESLVKDGDANCYDAALAGRPFVFQQQGQWFAPAFAVDWKTDDTPGFESGWHEPDKELRVHTAIDPQYRRARQEHLFARELIRPEGTVWRGTVDLHRIDPALRPQVYAQLTAFLEAAMVRIGKTKARAVLRMIGPVPGGSCRPWKDGERALWVLTLQSPTLLIDPRRAAEHWAGIRSHEARPGPDSDQDLLEAEYRRIWSKISGGTLRLVGFFARQSLAGGFMAWRPARHQNRAYNPFLLTDAGSVFVLEPSGDKKRARDTVQTWDRQGLPLPDWAEQLYGDDFRSNPYRPQEGFGEIAVNLSCHRALRPRDEEVHYLD